MFNKHQSFQDVLPELESLRARLGEAKGALDKEHLKSADLENKCTQLEEELKFKMSLLEKELVEVNSKLLIFIIFVLFFYYFSFDIEILT